METLYEKSSLILNPGVYDTGKVYCTKPFDGSGDLTFTRNSNATRVNADGLVEKVRQNLLLYSNDFSSAAWVPTGATTPTLTSGQADKDGGTNAWLISWGATIGTSYIYQSISNLTTTHTASCWVKGTAGLKIKFGYGLNIAQGADITFTGEWQRVSHTSSSGSLFFFSNFITGLASSFYVQYCQSELSDIATDYIPTTSAAVSVGPVSGLPRLDYSGGASCPSLLLEPQRTNSVIWSEQIDNSGWTKINGPTITTNIATAPDGYGGADGIQDTTGGTFKRVRQLFTVAPNGTHTASVFVKKETSETNYGGLALVFTNRWVYGIIDAVNGTITVSSDSIIASSSTKVEDYGTYWRFSLTVTDNQSNTSLEIAYYATLSTNGTSTGVGAGSVRTIWGLQLELGASYATSYIPTLSSAVTRVADSASKTGISSLIGQTEGVLYFEGTIEGVNSATTRRIFSLSDGTNANYLVVYNPANTRGLDFVTAIGGAVQCNITSSSTLIQFGQRFKVAIGYAQNDFAFYVNGVQIGIDGNGNVPSPIDKFVFARGDDAALFEGTNSQLLLFKTRLSNADLATLTAL